MQGIRNSYRDVCNKMGSRMEKDLLLRFSEYECVMLAPIVPHFSDNIWRNLLKKTSSIWKNSWPVVPVVDAVLSRSNDFMKKNVKNLRDTVTKKPKKVPANWHRPNKVYVYVNRSSEYDCIDIVLVSIILGNNLLYVFFKMLMMLKLRLYLLM